MAKLDVSMDVWSHIYEIMKGVWFESALLPVVVVVLLLLLRIILIMLFCLKDGEVLVMITFAGEW